MSIKELTKQRIEKLSEQHKHFIPIFGGAYHAVEYAQPETMDLHQFVGYLASVPRSAKFWGWEKGIEDALNTFCHLCMINPALIESYLNTRFSEIARQYEE